MSSRRAAGLLALAMGMVGLSAQTPPAQRRLTVVVPVLVLDKQGNPVPRLDQDLFRLSDNGHAQRITGFETAQRPVSLAIVVDNHDPDAIAQAKRSARLMAAMVVGADGEAAVYVSGPQSAQVLGFTEDQQKLVNALTHLALSPTSPQGQGRVTVPASQAVLDLAHRPANRTHAVLIIAKNDNRGDTAASALVENALHYACPVFRISPSPSKGEVVPQNADTTARRGRGPGSQRDPNVIPNLPNRGTPNPYNPDQATIDLTPIPREAIHLAGAVALPHLYDYVYDTGGITFGGGDDAAFDRQLSSIGEDLRGFYRLRYQPNDVSHLGPTHRIYVTVFDPSPAMHIARLIYRRQWK